MNMNGKENPKMIKVGQVINILRTDMKTDQKYSSILGNVHTLSLLLCILDNAMHMLHGMLCSSLYQTLGMKSPIHYPNLPFQFCGYSVWSQ
jgi:hypothetical protein